MAFAAPGSVTRMLFPSGLSCNNVSLWQWSGLFCDTRTTSGSSISERCCIALGTTLLVIANHGADTIELPTNHGSIRIENAPLPALRSSGNGWASGEKTRRKDESAFRCRIATDIFPVVFAAQLLLRHARRVAARNSRDCVRSRQRREGQLFSW